jgi:hypothetical protein
MPQDPIERTKHFARFTLPNGETVDGEFLLDGPQTHVILYMDRPHSARSGDFTTVHADLPAGECLSFLNCNVLGEETFSTTVAVFLLHEYDRVPINRRLSLRTWIQAEGST